MLKNPSKIVQIRLRGAKVSIFHWFLMPPGLHWSSNSAIRRTLLNRNKHRARAQFYHLRASPFGINFSCKISVFPDPLVDLLFSHVMLILCESYWFWEPSWNPVGAKMVSKINTFLDKCRKIVAQDAPCSRSWSRLSPQTPLEVPQAPFLSSFHVFRPPY